MARPQKVPKTLQVRLTEEAYEAIKRAFPDQSNSEAGRRVVEEWLRIRATLAGGGH